MQASQKLSVNKTHFWVCNGHIKNTVSSYQLYWAWIIHWQARERVLFFELITAYLNSVWILYIRAVILQVELFVLERRTHSTTIHVYIHPANVSKTFPSCKHPLSLSCSFKFRHEVIQKDHTAASWKKKDESGFCVSSLGRRQTGPCNPKPTAHRASYLPLTTAERGPCKMQIRDGCGGRRLNYILIQIPQKSPSEFAETDMLCGNDPQKKQSY